MRRKYPRRKFFKRNFRKSVPRTTKGKASKAFSMARLALRRQEVKYTNSSTYNTALSTTMSNTFMLSIPQGDTALTRDGNKLWLKSLKVRASFKCSAGSTLQPCAVRMLIWQDNQQISSSDLTSGSVMLSNTYWNSLYNFPAGVGRAKLLYDRTFNASPTSVGYASAGATPSSFDKYIITKFKVKGFRPNIEYNGANGGDIQKNGIYLMLIKSNSNYTVNPEIDWQIRYTDS